MSEAAKETGNRDKGCARTAVYFGLGLVAGALVGILLGLLLGVGAAMLFGLL